MAGTEISGMRLTKTLLLFSLTSLLSARQSSVWLGEELQLQTILMESPALFREVLDSRARQSGVFLIVETPPACGKELGSWVRAEGKVWLQSMQNGVDTAFGRMGQDGPFQVSFAEATFTLRACRNGETKEDSVMLQAFGHPEWASGRDLLSDVADSLLKASRDLVSSRLNSPREMSSDQ